MKKALVLILAIISFAAPSSACHSKAAATPLLPSISLATQYATLPTSSCPVPARADEMLAEETLQGEWIGAFHGRGRRGFGDYTVYIKLVFDPKQPGACNFVLCSEQQDSLDLPSIIQAGAKAQYRIVSPSQMSVTFDSWRYYENREVSGIGEELLYGDDFAVGNGGWRLDLRYRQEPDEEANGIFTEEERERYFYWSPVRLSSYPADFLYGAILDADGRIMMEGSFVHVMPDGVPEKTDFSSEGSNLLRCYTFGDRPADCDLYDFLFSYLDTNGEERLSAFYIDLEFSDTEKGERLFVQLSAMFDLGTDMAHMPWWPRYFRFDSTRCAFVDAGIENGCYASPLRLFEIDYSQRTEKGEEEKNSYEQQEIDEKVIFALQAIIDGRLKRSDLSSVYSYIEEHYQSGSIHIAPVDYVHDPNALEILADLDEDGTEERVEAYFYSSDPLNVTYYDHVGYKTNGEDFMTLWGTRIEKAIYIVDVDKNDGVKELAFQFFDGEGNPCISIYREYKGIGMFVNGGVIIRGTLGESGSIVFHGDGRVSSFDENGAPAQFEAEGVRGFLVRVLDE